MTGPSKNRAASGERKTSETEIRLSIDLDGSGATAFDTEIPFFEHMLSHVARHGLIDIDLFLRGDLAVDAHHSVEDTAILLGALLHEALGEKRGIRRYGHFTLPMDETLTSVAVDLGGRYHFHYSGPDIVRHGKFGVYDAELSLEFLAKLAMSAKMNLHVVIHHGENRHHLHESIFKALGRALRMAVEPDERSRGAIPSTKGVLE